MKKAVQISIAQTLFNIEEDAFQQLDDYLKSIKKHFAHNKENAEIIEDIEARIGEQLLESKKKIITLKEVGNVIESMGRIEDFDDDEEEVEEGEPAKKHLENPFAHFKGKKLYRNSKDKIIAGVCSGLAAYINVDALWVRLAFVLFVLLTKGFGLLVYLLLALLVPEAKTPSQKLEMEGSPVNLETMAESVKEKVEDIREKHGSSIRKGISWPFRFLKKIVDFLIKFFGPIIRILAGLIIFIVSLVVMVVLSILTHMLLTRGEALLDIPFSDIFSRSLFIVTTLAGYLIVLIPVLVIFILGVSLIRKKNLLRAKLGMFFLFGWCLALVAGAVGVFSVATETEEYVRTHDGLFITETKEIPITETIDDLLVSGYVHLNLIQGDEPSLVISGRKSLFSEYLVKQEEGDLSIVKRPPRLACFFCNFGNLEATLTLPDVQSISAYRNAQVTGEPFINPDPITLQFDSFSIGNLSIDAPTVKIKAGGKSWLNLVLNTKSTEVYAENMSDVYLRGQSSELKILAEYMSNINSKEMVIDFADATADYNSDIQLPLIKGLNAKADHWSNISYQLDITSSPDSSEFGIQESNGGRISGELIEDDLIQIPPPQGFKES